MSKSIVVLAPSLHITPILQEWLGDRKVNVLEYDRWMRGLGAIIKNPPWTVVVDIDDSKGLDLCEKIRENASLNNVKLVALSKGFDTGALIGHMFGSSAAWEVFR